MLKVDIYTKCALTVIAIALWVLILQPLYTPKIVEAGAHHFISSIWQGTCPNSKIC